MEWEFYAGVIEISCLRNSHYTGIKLETLADRHTIRCISNKYKQEIYKWFRPYLLSFFYEERKLDEAAMQDFPGIPSQTTFRPSSLPPSERKKAAR